MGTYIFSKFAMPNNVSTCRESVVISRERILNLNQEASEVDKKLIIKIDRHYQGTLYLIE